jgi:hypothetical protein
MPKNPIDYTQTVIYKIICNDLTIKQTYVGHTTDFTSRKNSHKSKCLKPDNKKYHLKVYQTIRDNGGWENWNMIQIELYPCENIHEAILRERYWFEKLNTCELNQQYPARTKEEYCQTNSKILSIKKKEYRLQNLEAYKIK